VGRKLLVFARNNILGLIAIVIAMGGSATALAYVVSNNSQIAGNTVAGHHPPSGKHANLVLGSINGADMYPNSISGTQINEATLGQVPSANRIGGSPLAAFSITLAEINSATQPAKRTPSVVKVQPTVAAGEFCIDLTFTPIAGVATIDAGAQGLPRVYATVDQATINAHCGVSTAWNAFVSTWDGGGNAAYEPFSAVLY
jgi:hypothetical protein